MPDVWSQRELNGFPQKKNSQRQSPEALEAGGKKLERRQVVIRHLGLDLRNQADREDKDEE